MTGTAQNRGFRKLLVPLDGTGEAAVALPLARTLARATGGEILLVRVLSALRSGAHSGDWAAAQENLASIARELGQSELRVASLVRVGGAPAEEIVREVERQGADLVVMATHGRVGLERVVLGGVAERVVATSSVPVALLRPGGHRVTRLTRLLVPLDGSPGGALALGVAAPLARQTGAQVHLLQVAVPLPADVKAQLTLAEATGDELPWDEELLSSAQAYVGRLAARLQRAGLAAEGHAVMGHISETIVGTADEVEADLIVMSTHALRGPARTVLGSITDEVVRSARRPVLIVPRRERGAPR